MNIADFMKLKTGDIVYVVLNTGIDGIHDYQYIGIFKSHTTNERYHVFLSGYFVSTVCIWEGNEKKSRHLDKIFKEKGDAIIKQNELRLADRKSRLVDENE